jgi:hypothetical protein
MERCSDGYKELMQRYGVNRESTTSVLGRAPAPCERLSLQCALDAYVCLPCDVVVSA